MYIRNYQSSDCMEIAALFYHTVHTVNAKDYTKEQLNAWATGNVDLKEWNKSFHEHYTVVAVENGIIIGFGDISQSGYLDRLYVHSDYQNKGVATAICEKLENSVACEITTQASITAKTFFEKRCYQTIKEQHVERNGIMLTNYIMRKQRKTPNEKLKE